MCVYIVFTYMYAYVRITGNANRKTETAEQMSELFKPFESVAFIENIWHRCAERAEESRLGV